MPFFRILFIAVILGLVGFAISIWMSEDEPKKKEEKEEAKVLTPLDKLKKLIGPEKDALTKSTKKISEIGNDLLNAHTENDVTRELLNNFQVFIEGCIENATSLAKKFRKAEQYLHTTNAEEINQDIEMLTKKISIGKTALEKALKEKQDTLKNLKIIKNNQEKKLDALMEIEATLQSLQASVVSVETGEKDEREAREDIQRSISALSQALDQNAEELEEEEVVLKEEVSKEV